MKLFEFSLQRLLDTREAMEESLELKLGQSLARVELSRRKLADIEGRIQNENQQMAKWNGRQVEPLELALRVRYAHWLEQERARQTEDLGRRQKESEAVRKEWLDAMKERKILDRLKEKERQEWRRDEDRKEQKTADELSSAVFFRRRQQA